MTSDAVLIGALRVKVFYSVSGCFILLRQVVNCKFKVQNLLVELQQKIGGITNEMRLETNKQGICVRGTKADLRARVGRPQTS